MSSSRGPVRPPWVQWRTFLIVMTGLAAGCVIGLGVEALVMHQIIAGVEHRAATRDTQMCEQAAIDLIARPLLPRVVVENGHRIDTRDVVNAFVRDVASQECRDRIHPAGGGSSPAAIRPAPSSQPRIRVTVTPTGPVIIISTPPEPSAAPRPTARGRRSPAAGRSPSTRPPPTPPRSRCVHRVVTACLPRLTPTP